MYKAFASLLVLMSLSQAAFAGRLLGQAQAAAGMGVAQGSDEKARESGDKQMDVLQGLLDEAGQPTPPMPGYAPSDSPAGALQKGGQDRISQRTRGALLLGPRQAVDSYRDERIKADKVSVAGVLMALAGGAAMTFGGVAAASFALPLLGAGVLILAIGLLMANRADKKAAKNDVDVRFNPLD